MRCNTNITAVTTNVFGICQGFVVVTRDVVRMAASARHLAARHADSLPDRLQKPLKKRVQSWLGSSYSGLTPSPVGMFEQPALGMPCSSCGTA